MIRRNRSTKIVATLGPSSNTMEKMRSLVAAGADVFRLNFSHGSHADHKKVHGYIRELEEEAGRPIAILQDLQGPKLRISTFADGPVELFAGKHFRLDLDPAPGDRERVHLPHREIFQALQPGNMLLLDDGKIKLKVIACDAEHAQTEVINGGPLSDRKGVNVPNAVLDVSPLTDKDRKDLEFGLALGVDWVALSFVQRPADVAEARKLIGGRAKLLSKLEKPSAIQHLPELIDLSDAIMVARGDLGVEMLPEDVPSLQKRIIRGCRAAGKPVVVATQMLESMIKAPAPTRAEASDVATAVYDGADAVMLSAESAAGDYPVESVTMMNRIIERTERDDVYRDTLMTHHPEPEATGPDAITAAARQVAETIGAAAIVTFTTSGSTTLRAARERPTVPILCLTADRETARRLALVWGVHSIRTQDARSFSQMVDFATKLTHEHKFGQRGDRIVVTAGVPFGTPGATNILRIAYID
ncbi:MAG: pyruvate kinase [Alphaproteobacteria bacterium]|nr:pyruvate kinase [Alphaproteobacteria bacterium]